MKYTNVRDTTKSLMDKGMGEHMATIVAIKRIPKKSDTSVNSEEEIAPCSPHHVAIDALEAAITRHESHIDGSLPTSPKSQMRLMDDLKKALTALEEMGDSHEPMDID